MKTIKNKNILICITGSIAAYKACEVIRILRKEGANTQIVVSKAAKKKLLPLVNKAVTAAVIIAIRKSLAFILI